MKRTLLAIAATIAVATAQAAPFSMNNGVDFGSNSSTSTSPINNLGYTGTLATSIYLGNPAVPGTAVIDTNDLTQLGIYGVTAGPKTSIAGTPISPEPILPGPVSTTPDNLNINGLNGPPVVTDSNGFTSGESPLSYGLAITGGKLWGLTYTYYFTGYTTATDVQFTGGYINVYYQDGGATANNGKQVAKLNVEYSAFQGVNLLVGGSFDYGFAGAADPFVQDFFHSDDKNVDFYDATLASPGSAKWTLNTNVVPPLPTPEQLWETGDPTNSTPGVFTSPLVRQSSLNGQITFAVPEPGSLALMGAALAGLGFVRRRKQAK